MFLKTISSFIIITVITAWFNYYIVLTQDIGDNQFWHIPQLIQWIVVYAVITWFSKEYLILVGYSLMYPFLYDGLLNIFLGKEWFYGGVDGYGADYTIDYRLKIVLFSVGLFIIFAKQYFNANNKFK